MLRRTNAITRINGTGRSYLLALAAAALALFAFAAHANPVGAAATLSASQNPVVVPWGQASKVINVSWNLGGVPKATLTITENGGPVVVTQGIITQTGSKPLTVFFGKSYTAKLSDPLNPATVFATLAITAVHPPLVPQDLGCAAQCITGVNVTPHGTFAGFQITTNELAHFVITVSTDAPDAAHNFSDTDSAMFNLGNVTSWNVNLLSLKPNTHYYYVVKATDTDGNKAYKEGQFNTLKRRLKVDFTKITMIDDSDDLSDCDCQFWFSVNGNAPLHWSGSPSTGEQFDPNKLFTITNAGDLAKLRVTGSDDDEFCGFFGLCSCGLGMPDGNGSNDCADWSTVTKNIDINVTGPGEAFSQPFEMTANGSPLKFKVSGTLTVSYVP